MDRTVIGVFDHYHNAERVMNELVAAGFDRNEIGMITPGERDRLREIDAREKAPVTSTSHPIEKDELTNRVGTGAAIGGASGLLLGLSAALLPGIGPVIAAGPLAAAIGAGALGAATGGLVGALSDAGVSHEDANFYAASLRHGNTLVTVNTMADGADRAATIMRHLGAIDIDKRKDQYRLQGAPHFSESVPSPSSDPDLSASHHRHNDSQ